MADEHTSTFYTESLRFESGSSRSGEPQRSFGPTVESVQRKALLRSKRNVNIQEYLWQNVKVFGGSV